MGSAFGPWGTAIGAGAGFVSSVAPKPLRKIADPLGIFGGGGGPDTRANNEFREVNPLLGQNAATMVQQNRQMARLQSAANGTAPSIAQLQANAALEQGRRALNSQAVSDRRNSAFARRNAMIQGGSLATRIQQQAMTGRLAEQQQAEAALAQAIHGARQADIARAGIIEQARSERFKSLMGVPSSQETQANVMASTLPMLGKAWDAYQTKKGASAVPAAPSGDYSGLPGLSNNTYDPYGDGRF
jgi:hypothetical protein